MEQLSQSASFSVVVLRLGAVFLAAEDLVEEDTTVFLGVAVLLAALLAVLLALAFTVVFAELVVDDLAAVLAAGFLVVVFLVAGFFAAAVFFTVTICAALTPLSGLSNRAAPAAARAGFDLMLLSSLEATESFTVELTLCFSNFGFSALGTGIGM